MEEMIDLEGLTEEEKTLILSVIKRDEELRKEQDTRASQLRSEIHNLRLQSVIRDGDDLNKICARCHKPFGFFFNTGDICSQCKFRVCGVCRESLLTGKWLCTLCYKQVQLKGLTGEWIQDNVNNEKGRLSQSGADLVKASLRHSLSNGKVASDYPDPAGDSYHRQKDYGTQLTTGRDYIQAAPDVYTKDLPHDTITGTVTKAPDGDGGDGVPETKRGVTRQNSASREDLDRVGYPQNADKKRLSNLFDSFKSSKDVPDKEHDIKHVSCRRRNVSDSDSGSSSDEETPMDVADSKTHSSDQMSSTSAAILARNLSETESASDLHRDQKESPEIQVPNGETQNNNKETSEGAESASTEHSRNSLSPEKPKMTPTEAVILSKRLSGPQDQLMVSQPSSSNSPVSPVHNMSHSLDHKPMIVRRTSSEKSDTSSMSSARTASPATKMRLLDMASKRALERESFDQEESGHDSPRHKPEDTPSNGVTRLRAQPSRTTSGTSSPGRHEFGEGSSVYTDVEWRSDAGAGGPRCTPVAVEGFHIPLHNLSPNTLPITHHFTHESQHHFTSDTDSREITPALSSSLSEHDNSGCGVNTESNISNVDSNTREVTPSQHLMHDELLLTGPLVQIGQSNRLLDRQSLDSDVTVNSNGRIGFQVLKSEVYQDNQTNLTFNSSSTGAIAAMSIHQKQNMMDTCDGTVLDQKTREEAMVPIVTGFHASPVVSQANSVVSVAIEASTPKHAEIMFEVTPHVLTEPQESPCHLVGAAVPLPQYQHSEMQNVSDLVEPVSGTSVESVHRSGDRSERYELSGVQNSSDLVEPVCRISTESMTASETEISKPALELEHNRCSFDPLVQLRSSEVSPSERTRESITVSSDSGSPDYDPVVVDIGISELMLGEPNPRLAVMVCMESMGSDSSPEDGDADNDMDSRPSGMENCSGIAVSSHQRDDILSSQICTPDIDITQTDIHVFEPTQKQSLLVETTQAGSPLFDITRADSPLVESTQENSPLANVTVKERPLVELTQAQCPQVESCSLSGFSIQEGKPASGQQQQNADSRCTANVPVAQQQSMCAPGSEDQVVDVSATAAGGIENSAFFETAKYFTSHTLSLTNSSNNSVDNACFDSEHNSDLFDRDISTAVNSHKHPDDTLSIQSHSEVNISCLTNSYKLSDSSDPPSLASDTTTSVLPSNVHAQYKCPASSSDNFTSARNQSPFMNRDAGSDDIPTHKNEPLTPKCVSSVRSEDIGDESASQLYKGIRLDSTMIVPQDAASASATSPNSCSGSDSDVMEVAEFPLYVSPRLSQEAPLSGGLAGTKESQLSGDPSSTKESQLSGDPSSTKESQLSGDPSSTQESQLSGDPSSTQEVQLSGDLSLTQEAQLAGDLSLTQDTQLLPGTQESQLSVEQSSCGAEEVKKADMKDTEAAYDGIVNGLKDGQDYEDITDSKSEPSLQCQRMTEEHMPDATSSPNHLNDTIDDEQLFHLVSMSRPQVSNSHPQQRSATRKSKDDSELKRIQPSPSTSVISSAASSAATVTNLSTIGLIANNDEGDPFASRPINISDAVQRYLQQDVDELSDCLSVITERTEPEDDDFSEISEGLDDTVEDEELDREIEKIYQTNISIESYCSSDSFGSGSAASAIRKARRGQQKKHIEEVLASPSSFELPVISEGFIDRPIQSKDDPSEQKDDVETIDKASITSDTISAYLSDMSSVDHSNRQTPTSSILATEEEVAMRITDKNGSDTASEDQDSAWFDMSLSVDSVKEVLAAKNSFPQDASMSASTETLCDEELPQDDAENVGDDRAASVPQVPETQVPELHVLETQVHETHVPETEIAEPQIPEPQVPQILVPQSQVTENQVTEPQVLETDTNSKQTMEENKVAHENVYETEISDCLEQVSTVNAIINASVPESDSAFPSIPLVPGHDLDASSPPSETLHPISNPSSQPNLHLQDQPSVTLTSATAASPSSSPPECPPDVGVNPPVMSDRTSETESHGDDSGHISGTSAENTPEHKSRHHSHLSIPSLVLTSTSAEEPQDREEEDEDIDDLVASHKSLGSLRGSRGNLYSSLTDSRESLYSVYSDAGEINFGKIPATGEILFGLDYNYKTGALEIHVKQCKDIAPVDTKRNRSDPYVKTYLLPDKTRSGKRKTKIKKHTLNPTFDEVLRYVISKSEVENRVLWVTVWHNDRFGRNDFLGEVMIPMDCYKFGDASPKWYPLQDRLEAPGAQPVSYKGDLVLSIKFVTADNLENDGSRRGKSKKGKAPPRGELQVLVKEAKNLTAVRSNGSSDPFCKAYLLPEKHKSSKQKSAVVKRNCNPTWNHVFLFEDVSQEEMKDRSLELTIWDYDKITSNDFLGGVRLNLGTGVSSGKTVEWMDARGEEIAIWQSCMDRPNCWNDGTIGLRATMGKSEIRK